MQTKAQVEASPAAPKAAATGLAGLPVSPQAPQPTPTAQFYILKRRVPPGSGTVVETYGVEYALGVTPPPSTVDAELVPEKGGIRRGPAPLTGDDIDLTSLFNQPGPGIAPEYDFGKTSLIKISLQGAILATLYISFDGLGSADAKGDIAQAAFYQLDEASRCAPHNRPF
jgi:hypothetical protein